MDIFTDNRTKITAGVTGIVQVLRFLGFIPEELAAPLSDGLIVLAALFVRLGVTNEARRIEAKVEQEVEQVAVKVQEVKTEVAALPVAALPPESPRGHRR